MGATRFSHSKHVPLSRRKSPESSRSRRGKRSECGHPSS
ncbi:hypothetical protein GBAR_LOCUS10890, partial [Geodia barretti]